MEKKLLYKKDYLNNNIHYEYVGEITEDGAMLLQEKAGYHPAGYGFYQFTHINGVARWVSSNNCD
tara:strand:+ start:1600 stop:1794 length:195 start_codon:yes stop_codon:yes gene_type:complete